MMEEFKIPETAEEAYKELQELKLNQYRELIAEDKKLDQIRDCIQYGDYLTEEMKEVILGLLNNRSIEINNELNFIEQEGIF